MRSATKELSCLTFITRTSSVWNKILLEAKAVESLTDSHVKKVLNYLAASKLRRGLLVNFGGDSLEWKRVVLCREQPRLLQAGKIGFGKRRPISVNSWNSCLIPLLRD